MTLKNPLFSSLALVFSLATLSPSMVAAQEIGESMTILVARGDANGDGWIDAEDPKLMGEILDNGATITVPVRNLDVNFDGKFDTKDPLVLSRFLTTLPAGRTNVEPEAERAVLGDANDDGRVDLSDIVTLALFEFQGVSLPAPEVVADISLDGVVDFRDLTLLLEAVFGSGPKSG